MAHDLTLTLGADVGNSSIKVRPDEGEPFTLPTVVDNVAHMDLFAEHKNPLKQLDLEIVESKTARTGRAFYGDMALATGNGKDMPPRSHKATAPEVLQALLCGIAVAVARKLDAMKAGERKILLREAEQHARPLRVLVNLGTGLPMVEYLDRETRKSFRRAIKGTHRVRWVSTPGWSDYPDLQIEVEELEVASEGMAVLYDLVFDHSGGLRDPKLAKGHVLINDIGANTHDQPYYAEMELVNALSKPYDSNLSEQMVAIAEQVNPAYNRRLTRQDLEQFIFRLKHAIPNGNQPPISIRHITEPRFRALAARYASRIKTAFENSKAMLTHVVMVGGGAAVVKDYLEDELATQGVPVPFPFEVLWPDGAQMSNANGYLKLIEARLRKKAQTVTHVAG